MTVQCKQVVDECDFKTDDIKTIEEFLTKVTPTQLISLVWSKDRNGEHNAEWFRPFIMNRYIKWTNSINCSFNEDFWYAYNIFDSITEINIFDFPKLQEMGASRKKLKKALEKSRVQNVNYVYRIFKDQPDEKIVNNAGMVQHEFKSAVCNIREL